MESYRNAITEMTILRNSLIKLSKDFESVDLGCIGEGEVSLYLGDNWFVSVQKTDALEIIKRRIQFLDSQISNLQFAALKAEMSDFVDIVEQEDESISYIMPSDNAYCKQAKNVGEFEENLFKLIKDLEAQEISDIHDDDSIHSSSESLCEQDSVDLIKKHVSFAADTKFDEPIKSSRECKTVKDLIVEREVESFDDDSDLEDYHIGREVSREYVALRDRIGIADQELKHKGRGLDTFKPKLSEFKRRSLASKEI